MTCFALLLLVGLFVHIALDIWKLLRSDKDPDNDCWP